MANKEVARAIDGVRADLLGLRADMAHARLESANHLQDISGRLTTLFDEVAAFRAEYNNHTHP